MEFDKSCVDTLLSLPCVIDDTKILTETPIFTTAEKIEDTVYSLCVNEGESLSDFLRRVYQGDGPYPMDCSVYSQLASRVLSDKWPSNGGELLLFIGRDLGDYMLWTEKIPQMGYIAASDISINQYLCKTETSCKGQWCIKVSPDQYLGLSQSGPMVLSLSSWAGLLRCGLFSYLENPRFNSDPLHQLIRLYAKTARLDSWGIFYEKEECDVIVQCETPEPSLGNNLPRAGPERALGNNLLLKEPERSSCNVHSIMRSRRSYLLTITPYGIKYYPILIGCNSQILMKDSDGKYSVVINPMEESANNSSGRQPQPMLNKAKNTQTPLGDISFPK